MHSMADLAKSHFVNLATRINLTWTKAGHTLACYPALSLLARLVAYVSILTIMLIIVLIIVRCMTYSEDEGNEVEVRATETDQLWPRKALSSDKNSCSEELYDRTVCVICYDEERNCFYVPCGHCATCYVCAQRIFNSENKVCPVCRRFIGKIRKLFAP
ncbi:apoptosis inhibitor [Salix suchowensis]|nr:apoptosis inhibitor [Salix suchowensis]